MPTIKKKYSYKKKKIPYNNSDIDFAKYYNSKGWKHLRNSYIEHHPLCEECLLKGIVREAQHVHHKIPFSTGKTEADIERLLLDPNNLQALCIECHHKKHKNNFHKKKTTGGI